MSAATEPLADAQPTPSLGGLVGVQLKVDHAGFELVFPRNPGPIISALIALAFACFIAGAGGVVLVLLVGIVASLFAAGGPVPWLGVPLYGAFGVFVGGLVGLFGSQPFLRPSQKVVLTDVSIATRGVVLSLDECSTCKIISWKSVMWRDHHTVILSSPHCILMRIEPQHRAVALFLRDAIEERLRARDHAAPLDDAARVAIQALTERV